MERREKAKREERPTERMQWITRQNDAQSPKGRRTSDLKEEQLLEEYQRLLRATRHLPEE